MSDEEKDVQVEETPVEEGDSSAPAESSPAEGTDEKTVPYERFKEVNDQLKQLKEAKDKKEPVISDPQPSAPDDAWKMRMEFTVKNRDLESEVLDEIFAYAEGKGISYAEAKDSKVIQSLVKSIESERESEQATPSPSRPVVNPMSRERTSEVPRFEDGKPVNPAKPISGEEWLKQRNAK